MDLYINKIIFTMYDYNISKHNIHLWFKMKENTRGQQVKIKKKNKYFFFSLLKNTLKIIFTIL